MLAAATAADPIAAQRQNARLFQSPPRGRGRVLKRRLDPRPGPRRWIDRLDLGREHAEPALPVFDLGAERRLLRQPPLEVAALRCAEHAQHIFRGQRRAVVGAYGALVAHRSRHSLSRSRLRRIQLFIVPSGTSIRCGQLFIGGAIEERRADRAGVARLQAHRGNPSAAGVPRRLSTCASALGRGVAHLDGVVDRLHPAGFRAGAQPVDRRGCAQSPRAR